MCACELGEMCLGGRAHLAEPRNTKRGRLAWRALCLPTGGFNGEAAWSSSKATHSGCNTPTSHAHWRDGRACIKTTCFAVMFAATSSVEMFHNQFHNQFSRNTQQPQWPPPTHGGGNLMTREETRESRIGVCEILTMGCLWGPSWSLH